jgi:signal transduction histidine kinase
LSKVKTAIPRAADKLAAAHARFAKAALLTYLGAASVAVALLVAMLFSDRNYDELQTKNRVLLETQVRAHYLSRHLDLLVEELQRLGLRSEINLLDHNMEPERMLLRITHSHSTFFNLGVAIVSRDGEVLWGEPRAFLASHASFGGESWFVDARQNRVVSIVPVDPDQARNAVVYVVSPIVRNDEFTGALVGGIDLAKGQSLGAREDPAVLTVLATERGSVVYPPTPPAFATESGWTRLFSDGPAQPFVVETRLEDTPAVVAGAPLSIGKLRLLSVADRDALFSGASQRLYTRLALGLCLALAPLVALIYLLKRSLKEFRRSEEEAVREQRLQRIGEAANQIAHEVRNSLNGLRMGLDLVLRDTTGANQRVVGELRAEIERLSSFTHQLMLFAKDPTPRLRNVDLTTLVPRTLNLTRDLAAELGVEVEVSGPYEPLGVLADPTLLEIVVSNLVSNALDALAGDSAGAAQPRIKVVLDKGAEQALLRVVDNGPGVPAELGSSLFEPFVTGKPSGVGIGLALSRKIARAHGGDLALEPTPAGASFVLTLPLETGDARRASSEPAPARSREEEQVSRAPAMASAGTVGFEISPRLSTWQTDKIERGRS